MSIFKCKMCGGSLEVAAGETIIECEYCGTQQTLPKTTDENVQALFNRANLLRQKNEFDKAEAVYEKILEADDTEAEAYWGVILCKFGIEYVEDPKTYKRIPTCHRTSYDSIVADEYYKKAIENADITQRTIYEAEAKKIDEIQKGILAISAQEEPYDVFICYKETDENGKRTQDSVIANDIYYQLTQEGFKVFYAAITLEDKLGSAYEPIIFAALNSSKVMLSIGTKPEYFSAVWVKNEWSRFLKMMKNDRSKMLIPCYKGMDAYELPEEFAHLQAQDMGKIGFINDIVRGIKKVIVKDEPKTTIVKETVVTSSNSSVDPLLKRAFMFLEDRDWENAIEYCEKVLDIDPENIQAYLGKFLANFKVKEIQELKSCTHPFDSDSNYQKCIRFGDDELKATLKEYNKYVTKKQSLSPFEYKEHSDGIIEITGILNRATKSIEIPNLVTIIGDHAFKDCRDLTSVVIPDSVTSIGKEAFESCWHLTSIVIPNSVTSIGEHAFSRCFGLTSIVIPDGVTSIGEHAFSGCDELTSIAIPDSVTSIGYGAFSNCDSLKDLVIPDGISISDGVFLGYPGLKSIVIPDGVTSIGEAAFYRCTNLRSVVIPDGVTSIGEDAFACCDKLTSIVIPNSVTSIGERAFIYCRKLKSIVIPDSVTSIGFRAFAKCGRLRIKCTKNGKLKHVHRGIFSGYDKLTLNSDGKLSSGGCYVATCVYGSYDCPEVWTLRRFRDNTLGSTWYGRTFIRIYYAISPTLVKWFGHTNWFKRMWRGTLDKMVNKLNSQGVENTPYTDKTWRK